MSAHVLYWGTCLVLNAGWGLPGPWTVPTGCAQSGCAATVLRVFLGFLVSQGYGLLLKDTLRNNLRHSRTELLHWWLMLLLHY